MTQHLSINGRLVTTQAEADALLADLGAELRRHLKQAGLVVAPEPLPLPTGVGHASYTFDGMRRIWTYTLCDPQTGEEGFMTRVDTLAMNHPDISQESTH